MKTNIQIFKNEMFGEIRTLTNEKGETFFVGKDVAKALGYTAPRNALATHVDEEDKTTALIQCTGSNYKSKSIIINESGLYSLILSSKLDRAREFKHWVTSEMLPQIRMTGGYIPTKDADGRQLTDAEIVDRAHDIIGRTLEMVNSQNADCLTATQVAQLWGMEVHSFNNLLAGMGIQHRKGGRWQLAPELLNCGLAEERLYCSYSLKGKYRTQRYLVWTPEGVRFLDTAVRKLPRDGGPMTSVQLNIVFNG
ncbi:MAG: phage antirepressor KilAC domain-containing protein [Bacteroidaceae bacterium]|nr:phage antirepressor KilAC domain-containing protein [Bacteroidaceae bacterium]